jgi:hypothetical protein
VLWGGRLLVTDLSCVATDECVIMQYLWICKKLLLAAELQLLVTAVVA